MGRPRGIEHTVSRFCYGFLRSRIFSRGGYCYDSSYHGIKVISLQIKSASLQYCFQYRTELLAFKQRIAACAECGKREDHGF
jgi:hypothetical protein